MVWVNEERLFSWQKSTCSGFAKVKYVGRLNPEISEASGLTYWNGQPVCINDSNDTLLYVMNQQYEIEAKVGLPQLKNFDWEELQVDDEGIIWVGETGINNFPHKQLALLGYHVQEKKLEKLLIPLSVTGKQKVLDFEAFFWRGNQLFLFSKFAADNLHRIYVFEKKGSVLRKNTEITCWAEGHITGVAFDAESSTVAMATYGRIFIYKLNGLDFQPKACLPIRHGMQMEAIAWKKPGLLVFLNEEGHIFELEL